MTSIPASKVCFTCGQRKPAEEFWRQRDHKDGLYSQCKPCQREYNRLWWWGLDRREYLRRTAKQTAKRKGVPFDLSIEDIVIPDQCPVFNHPFNFKKKGPWSPSLDRIVPSLGYIAGNIIVVSWRANHLKGNASIKELLALAGFYSQLSAERLTR